MKDQIVRSGAGQYICEVNALKYLPEKLSYFRNPMIVSGKKSYQAFLQFVPCNLKIPVLFYDESASHEDITRLANLAQGADVIIGIGGGKVLDSAKGTANLLKIDIITIPTVISTCAAFTPFVGE